MPLPWLRRMQAPVFVAWAATCVVVNFLTVSRWRTVPVLPPVMNVLTGTAVLHGWPVVEPDEWIVVDPARREAAIEVLRGTVEEWYPRLTGGGLRSYSVAIDIRRSEPGPWSPWCQRAELTLTAKPLVRGDQASLEADLPLIREAWIESQVARGARRELVETLAMGSATRIDWFAGFIVNDVVVGAVVVAGIITMIRLLAARCRRRDAVHAPPTA